MPKDSQHQKDIFFNLPKVELHRHMEGSLRLATMLDIAKNHQLDLPYQDIDKFQSLVQVMPDEPATFQNFLSKFASLRKLYQSPEIIRQVAQEAVFDAAKDNILYLEMRFTPVALTRMQNYPLGEAMDWVIEAVDKAASQAGIQAKLIASVNRHESLSLAEEVINLAADRQSKGIVGIDLAGSEPDFPGDEFAPIFQEARQAGLQITAHAGEWGGPEIITLMIEKLGAQRIGHGVRVLEDSDVVALTKERQIPFEVCPTSNYQSGVVGAIKLHPLPKMLEAGLYVTINTDDPGISQIDLSNEYRICHKSLNISLETLHKLILDAAKASFLPPEDKSQLIATLQQKLVESAQQ